MNIEPGGKLNILELHYLKKLKNKEVKKQIKNLKKQTTLRNSPGS